MPAPRAVLHLAALAVLATPAACAAQAFVEYPAYPATHGDHVIAATWPGGPSAVSVVFESDEAILHDDGIGQSQRTARNTLTFTMPSDSTNPQDFDDVQLIARYGGRLPLLQQMSAHGVSVLRYVLAANPAGGFDLFVTDVDSADSLAVSASGPGGVPLDMRTWTRVAGGDLSLHKDTGTAFSAIVAPQPVLGAAADAIALVAANATNYNRSYTILRAPAGTPVSEVAIRFRGQHNSATRAEAGTGAHIYMGLATTPATAGATAGAPGALSLTATSPARGAIELRVRGAGAMTLRIHDVAGRMLHRAELPAAPDGALHRIPLGGGAARTPGVRFVAIQAGGQVIVRRVVVVN